MVKTKKMKNKPKSPDMMEFKTGYSKPAHLFYLSLVVISLFMGFLTMIPSNAFAFYYSYNMPPAVSFSVNTASALALQPIVFDIAVRDSTGIAGYSVIANDVDVASYICNNVECIVSKQLTNAKGTYEYKVRATDNLGKTTTTAPITIIFTNNMPIITSIPQNTTNAGVLYSYQVKATDADNDNLIFSLVNNSVPNLHIDANGLLSWIPDKTQRGSYNITIQVDDSESIITQTFELFVLNSLPGFTSLPVTIATEGTLYQYNVDASNADNDGLAYSLVQSPAAMVIDSSTGLIGWTPGSADIGMHDISVMVNDSLDTALQNFTISVSRTNHDVGASVLSYQKLTPCKICTTVYLNDIIRFMSPIFNAGSMDESAVPVELISNGNAIATETINLMQGQTTQLGFDYKMNYSGEQNISIMTSLAGDNNNANDQTNIERIKVINMSNELNLMWKKPTDYPNVTKVYNQSEQFYVYVVLTNTGLLDLSDVPLTVDYGSLTLVSSYDGQTTATHSYDMFNSGSAEEYWWMLRASGPGVGGLHNISVNVGNSLIMNRTINVSMT